MLTEVTQLALKIDNEINGADASQTTPVAPADPNAMDISAFNARLSESDRQQMMRQGLCFRCGEHGHILQECPLKGTSTGTRRGKGKDKVRIDTLEEEVKKITECLKKEGRADASKNGAAQA
jgi:hypothetical protein